MALISANGCVSQPADGRPGGEPLVVSVTADRPGALYLPGEKAAFTIEVACGGRQAPRGEVEVWLSRDGGPGGIETQRFDLAAGSSFQVEGSVDEPSFLLCQAWASAGSTVGYGEKVVWYRAPDDPDQVTIALATGRADALYRAGEPATFIARVTRNGQPLTGGRLELRLSREGDASTIAGETFDLTADRPLEISGTLPDAGFLYCQARLIGDETERRPVRGWASWTSAGFDVEKIAPRAAMPGDFEAFWQDTLARARRLPADVELVAIEALSNDRADYYHFSIGTLDQERVYGFLGVPRGPGPFPAVVLYPGAGPGWGVPIDLGLTPRGAITLMMNVHKYPVAESRAEAQTQMQDYVARHDAANYLRVGSSSRETYHFHAVLAGFCRALDYICSRADWDRKHLVVGGSSQGGFLTLATAGLYADKVTSAMAGVPALSDYRRTRGTDDAATLDAMAYYDAANFARFIRCPIMVSVGFRDGSCPPASVFSAYNAIPGKDKKILMGVDDGHGITPDRQARGRDRVLRGLGFQ